MPVTKTKVVDTTVCKTVKTKKYVTVPAVRKVKKHYYSVERRPAVRWVKHTVGDPINGYVRTSVPEEYLKKVRVHKTKTGYVPTTKIKTVSDYKVVSVPSKKIIEYQSSRDHYVPSTKVVEMDDYSHCRPKKYHYSSSSISIADDISLDSLDFDDCDSSMTSYGSSSCGSSSCC